MRPSRAIVCLSGIGGSEDEWVSAASLLSSVGRVTTSWPATGEVILIGHSQGGLRALNIAARRPDRVAALVLTSAFFPPARAGRSVAESVRDYGRHRLAYAGEVTARGRLPRPTREGVRQLGTAARLGLRPRAFHRIAAAVKCPVLVVHGTADHVVPIAFARAAVARHSRWTLREMHGGHRLHVDIPREWAGVVIDWLVRPAA
jgi:pimeloyl-ACP methyl ester carboxylesterase